MSGFSADELEEQARKARTAAALNKVYAMKTGKKLGQGKKSTKDAEQDQKVEAANAQGGSIEAYDEDDDTVVLGEDQAEYDVIGNDEYSKSKIAELEKIIKEQEDELDMMDSNLLKMEKREKKLNKQLEEAKAALERKTDSSRNEDKLNSRVTELEKQLHLKSSELDSAQKSLSGVEREAESLKAQKSQFEKEVAELKERVKQAQEAASKAEDESEIFRINDTKKFELESRMKRMELESGEKDSEIERLKKAIAETEKNFEALKRLSETPIETPKAKEPMDSELKSSFEKERDVLNELIADQRLDIERWSSKSNKLERELKEKESEMQALEERLRQSKLDSHKLQDTLHARRRTQHYSTNISTPKELEREQKYILEAKLDLDRRIRELDERDEKLSRQESDLAIKFSEFNRTQSQDSPSAKAREVDMLARIDKLLCQITVLEETVGDLTNERNQLRVKIDADCEEIAILKAENENLLNQLSGTSFSQEQLHESQSKKLLAESNYDNLSDEMVLVKSENDKLKKKLSNLERDLARKGQDNSALINESSKKQVEVNVLYYELEGLRAENRALKRALDESKCETESARRKICSILDKRNPVLDSAPRKAEIPRKTVSFRAKPSFDEKPTTKSRYAQLYADMLEIQAELQDKERIYEMRYKK